MIIKKIFFYVKKMQKSFIVLCAALVSCLALCGCVRKNEEQLMLLPLEGNSAATDTKDLQSADYTDRSAYINADASTDSQELLPDETKTVTVCVHVCGAVCTPGVYELPEGSRVYEAIEMAGGFSADACPDYVNLAQTITDETQIVIPTIEDMEEGRLPMTGGGEQSGGDGRININTADAESLCTLPGIGQAKAEAIISYRNRIGKFDTIEQIMEVEGIKNGMYLKIQDKICVK